MELTTPHPKENVPALLVGARRRAWRRRLGRFRDELWPLLVVLLFLVPFLVMATTAFKTEDDTFSLPPRLWPRQWVLDNYERVFDAMPFWRYLGNTVFLAL